MRDISHKVVTFRTAVARAFVKLAPDTILRIRNNDVPKGDPRPVAKVAAIQAAKNTSQIIPYCHPIAVEFVGVDFELQSEGIRIETTVKATEKTGVEMEALTAASVAALTIYDMVKMFDDTALIEGIVLIEKTGGKSDFKPNLQGRVRAAIFVFSDRVSTGKAKDKSGKIIAERLAKNGIDVIEYVILPDDETEIIPAVRRCTDELKVDLVVTTGGTGIGPRDNTPEALAKLIETPLPGVSEAIRTFGQARTPYAMFSRATAGVRKNAVIVSLPGSKGGVEDALDVLLPHILHALPMLSGEGHETPHQEAQQHAAHTHKTEHDAGAGHQCEHHHVHDTDCGHPGEEGEYADFEICEETGQHKTVKKNTKDMKSAQKRTTDVDR